LMEKIEDLTTFIFLPLYFAYSGLRTNLGTLSSGEAWGGVILIITLACVGKIVGVVIASKLLGSTWRDALTVGILMNTKGLVELIVLNIGLDAGIIDTRVFTVMVIMALVTTFMTSPIVSFLYPPKLRQLTLTELYEPSENLELGIKKPDNNVFKSLLLILSPEVIPYAQNLSNLLFGGQYSNILHICKTFIVTERESSLMNVTKSSIDKSFGSNSPAMIQHFSKFENLKICSERIIAITQDLPVEVIETVSVHDLNLVLLPWLQAEEDREGHLPQIIRYLLGGCPATIALYVPCRPLSVSGPPGTTPLPFLGRDNDIETL